MSKTCQQVTTQKKPDWLKIRLHNDENFGQVAEIVAKNELHTICSSGRCPNKTECWSRRTATLMILGDICTRHCAFCATNGGRPLPPDIQEPIRVAGSIRLMGLRHAVVTSVTRDDLPDRGAAHWAQVIRAVHSQNPNTTIEALIPDLDGRNDLLDIVLDAAPDIVGHNLETVARLTPAIRNRAKYKTSLDVLRYIAQRGAVAKSGLMLGLGETESEILHTLDDLAAAGCRIVTLGQYLRPTLRHAPVVEYLTPEQFSKLGRLAQERGFDYVASGPMVRSSYRADEALASVQSGQTRKI